MTPLFGQEHGYWRPATMLVLGLAHRMGGAFGVHLLALALHTINSFAIRSLVARVLPSGPALWVAVMFAVHPVQAESVAWCAALNDPLWVTFALQAMLAAARWRDAGRRGLPWLVGAFVFLSLSAKEAGAVTIPLVLATLVWLPTRSNAPKQPAAWRRALAMSMTAAALWFVARSAARGDSFDLGLLRRQASPLSGLTDVLRWPQLLVAQLGLLIAPLPQNPVRTVPELPAGTSMVFTIAVGIAAVAVWSWRRRLSNRARFGLALMLLPVLPTVFNERTIGIYPIADRYAYLSAAGVSLLLAVLPGVWRWPRLLWLAPLLIAPWTFRSTWLWSDMRSFCDNAVAVAPDDPLVLTLAGDHHLTLAMKGDWWALGQAYSLYSRAIAAVPAAESRVQLRRSAVTANLGFAWCKLLRTDLEIGTADEALAAFQVAIEAAPENASAWVGMGIACGKLRRLDAANEAFHRALQLDPDSSGAKQGLEHLQAMRTKPLLR
ncbi:MAG: hypothetical protein ABIP94_02935 [Planctomycetota bacterium]